MRYRLMATYLGVPYHAGLGPDGNEVTLFSPGPPPEELGFTAAPGHWRKQVSVTDLSALWQSRLVGEYRGEPCLVLDDLGERLHIVYLGRDAVRARQLGYWEIDREVFEVVVARADVDGLTEERVEFPLSAAMFPASNPAPPPDAGPLFDVFRPVGGSSPPGPPSSPPPGPEPETLVQSRLDAQGRVIPRVSGGPPGPRTRMEPILGTRSPAPPGYPGQDRGPRTTDRAAAWHGSPGSPGPGPWSRDDPRPGPPWTGRDHSPGPAQPRPRPEPRPRPGGGSGHHARPRAASGTRSDSGGDSDARSTRSATTRPGADSASGPANFPQGPGLAPGGFCRAPQPGRHCAGHIRGRRGGARRNVPGEGRGRLRGVQLYR